MSLLKFAKDFKIPVFILFLFALFSCGSAIKTLVGFKNPKVETKASLLSYLSEVKENETTYFLKADKIGDSTTIYRNFLFGFNSDLLMFSKNGQKYCYLGTEECSGAQMTKAFNNFEENYAPCTNDSTTTLSSLLDKLVDKSGKRINNKDLPVAEYYIFQSWNKYSSSTKRLKEDINWLYDLKKNSTIPIEIVLVNTDLLEDWGLEKNGELPVKFKKEGKTIDVTFGKLPLKK
jgi:hypothetical protein